MSASSDPWSQSSSLTGGKSERSVGPGVGNKLTTVHDAGPLAVGARVFTGAGVRVGGTGVGLAKGFALQAESTRASTINRDSLNLGIDLSKISDKLIQFYQ